MTCTLPPADVTLGLLAGGRATRLGGLDKAWLMRDGVPQVLRLARQYRPGVSVVRVSANRGRERHASAGLPTVVDRVAQAGPLSALDALLHACTTPWLLTLPVDVLDPPENLLPRLAAAVVDPRTRSTRGAFARDTDGPQPLCALWPVAEARGAVAQAIACGELAVHAVQSRLGMAGVAWPDCRFGNLNTLADLAAAGIRLREDD